MSQEAPAAPVAGVFRFTKYGLALGGMAKISKKKRQEIPKLLQLDSAKMAAQIRGARAVLNWSQTDLAARAGLTQHTVHRLEQGTSDIRRSTALAIENVLSEAGVQFEQLPDSGFKIVISGRTLRKVRATARK
jgi:DNA-binding XRE family transcriptional regulator